MSAINASRRGGIEHWALALSALTIVAVLAYIASAQITAQAAFARSFHIEERFNPLRSAQPLVRHRQLSAPPRLHFWTVPGPFGRPVDRPDWVLA
jgi:hypothetical protein